MKETVCGTCPACGFTAEYLAFETPYLQGTLSALLGKLTPELNAAVRRYLSVFVPVVSHRLTASTAMKHLEPLVADILRGAIDRDRRQWSVPAALWLEAFEVVQDARAKSKLNLPLADHGYLYEVIARKANAADAAAETATEAARRDGRHRPVSTAAPQPQPASADIWTQQVQFIASTIRSRFRDALTYRRPLQPLATYAQDYRRDYGDDVVNAALLILEDEQVLPPFQPSQVVP